MPSLFMTGEQRPHPRIAVRRPPAEAVDPRGHGLAPRPRNTHERRQPPVVMPGLVPGIHVLFPCRTKNSWMAGTSPAMTNRGIPEAVRSPSHRSALDLRKIRDAVQRAANLREHQQPVAAQRRVLAVHRDVVEEGVDRFA